MNGTPPTHTPRSGQMLIKMITLALVVMLTLCSCSDYFWVGEGRGDWALDLYGGYVINRTNSFSKSLVYKESPADSWGTYVIVNYYVTAYQLHHPYICLEGFLTEETFASEDEMKNHILIYYVVDADNHKVFGPFENREDFDAFCTSIDIELSDEWEILPN